jgi:hypothetical protein
MPTKVKVMCWNSAEGIGGGSTPGLSPDCPVHEGRAVPPIRFLPELAAQGKSRVRGNG